VAAAMTPPKKVVPVPLPTQPPQPRFTTQEAPSSASDEGNTRGRNIVIGLGVAVGVIAAGGAAAAVPIVPV